jgi:Tol biopolymer transport system component
MPSSEIVFAAVPPAAGDQSADIYMIHPNGSDLQRLTTTSVDETQPSLSPDQRLIVYVRKANGNHCGGCPESLWRIAADGGGPRELTSPYKANSDTPYDDSPSWSPDSRHIAYARSGPNSSRLWTISAAGGAALRLPVSGWYPAWGPRRIAYISGSNAIRTILPDGASPRTLSSARDTLAGSLAWSHEGQLAYLGWRFPRLFIVVLGGNQPRRIELPGLRPTFPVGGLGWSPDGQTFAFVAKGSRGGGRVFTIGVDGRHLTQITQRLSAVSYLSWR